MKPVDKKNLFKYIILFRSESLERQKKAIVILENQFRTSHLLYTQITCQYGFAQYIKYPFLIWKLTNWFSLYLSDTIFLPEFYYWKVIFSAYLINFTALFWGLCDYSYRQTRYFYFVMFYDYGKTHNFFPFYFNAWSICRH